jgi:hypothetical protein
MTMPALDIDALVDDLKPVRRVRPADPLLLSIGATLVAVTVVALRYGLRPDVLGGIPEPIVLLRGGALLLLGFASLAAVIAAARPGVGQSSTGWRWALAAAALFPATGVMLSLLRGEMPMAELTAASGPLCLGISIVSATMIGGLVTVWLRTGAPVAIERAGWLTGLAAGAFGTFAYSLHCAWNSVAYIGFWYTLAIALCAILGRLVVPRIVRW